MGRYRITQMAENVQKIVQKVAFFHPALIAWPGNGRQTRADQDTRRNQDGQVNKKQFIVLLCVAAWLSAVAIYEAFTWSPGEWGIFISIITKSIPAFAFGVVLYFWFGRKSGQR